MDKPFLSCCPKIIGQRPQEGVTMEYESAFHSALESRDAEVLQMMVKSNPDSVVINKGLTDAVKENRLDRVLLLLESGVDVNHRQQVYWHGETESGLHYVKALMDRAVSRGFHDIAEVLMSYGADMRFTTDKFFTFYADVRHCESLKVVVKHLVERLEEYDDLWELEKREDLSSFKDQCEREIEKIKACKFSNNDTDVSLYEVWKSDLIQLTAYLMNEDITGSLKPAELEANFPIYAGRIIDKLKQGFERKFRIARVFKFFESLSTRKEHQLPRLPAPCVKEIFDLLSTKDLINLRNAYY